MTPWHQLPQHIYALVADTPNSVLLQTARFDAANQTSYLYLNPIQILTAQTLADLPRLFNEIESALSAGHHAAGYLSYECGYHFEPHAHPSTFTLPTRNPLTWFGIYSDPITFNHATGLFSQTPPNPTQPGSPTHELFTTAVNLDIDETDYRQQVLHIKDLIAAGDTYQVNFTSRVSLETHLSPDAAFSVLSRQQAVSYAAFLNIANSHVLSLSPELFFKIDADRIITRPMKGTMPRGLDLEEDSLAALHLQHDEKNRSEHVMIVDLLRNDLGRISTMGSVHVEDLFTVERYETLHQMTSTISATLRPNLSFYEIFRALFPSGSITGAPKIRTMQIIREIESTPRGVYTGAIGHITPNRNATFNVAIRTIILKDGHAEMGVGGGIVTDSEPYAEYRECLLKASFLTRPPHDFQLIETILYDPSNKNEPFCLLDFHLDRLTSSAAYFNFPCNRAAMITQLKAFTQTLTAATQYRIRLLLYSDGSITLTSFSFAPTKPTGQIRISKERTNSRNLFFRHKTTRRDLYNSEYMHAVADGFDEVLFLNERDELTEGAISNIFIRKGDQLVTPALSSGALPGIYRRHILETHPNALEQVLTFKDLQTANTIYICNSFRGMNQVHLTIEPDHLYPDSEALISTEASTPEIA